MADAAVTAAPLAVPEVVGGLLGRVSAGERVDWVAVFTTAGGLVHAQAGAADSAAPLSEVANKEIADSCGPWLALAKCVASLIRLPGM